MARIPSEVIDRIRDSVDISDVIGHYVQLHQSGKGFVGLLFPLTNRNNFFTALVVAVVETCFNF